jgi:hypothetical protein
MARTSRTGQGSVRLRAACTPSAFLSGVSEFLRFGVPATAFPSRANLQATRGLTLAFRNFRTVPIAREARLCAPSTGYRAVRMG